jgi:hypothetical protein
MRFLEIPDLKQHHVADGIYQMLFGQKIACGNEKILWKILKINVLINAIVYYAHHRLGLTRLETRRPRHFFSTFKELISQKAT